jgi:hypothetical protein
VDDSFVCLILKNFFNKRMIIDRWYTVKRMDQFGKPLLDKPIFEIVRYDSMMPSNGISFGNGFIGWLPTEAAHHFKLGEARGGNRVQLWAPPAEPHLCPRDRRKQSSISQPRRSSLWTPGFVPSRSEENKRREEGKSNSLIFRFSNHPNYDNSKEKRER